MERTIWWQKTVALMSNRSRRPPAAGPGRHRDLAQRVSSTRRRMGAPAADPGASAEGPEVVLAEEGVGRSAMDRRSRGPARARRGGRGAGRAAVPRGPGSGSAGPRRAPGVEARRGDARPTRTTTAGRAGRSPTAARPGRGRSVRRARRRGRPGPRRARRRRCGPRRPAPRRGPRPRDGVGEGCRRQCAGRAGRRSRGTRCRRRRREAQPPGAGSRVGQRGDAGGSAPGRRRRGRRPRCGGRSGSKSVRPTRSAPSGALSPWRGPSFRMRSVATGAVRVARGRSRRRACAPCPCHG